MQALKGCHRFPRATLRARTALCRTAYSPVKCRGLASAPASDKDAITLSTAEASTFARWKILPPIGLVMVPTGAIYTWSVWHMPLTKLGGVLAPAALDWDMGSVATTFSCLAVGFGIALGGLGGWMGRVGPRRASLAGAALFGGGHVVAAAGAHLHALPLVWLGWGVCGGLGWGLCFLSPIAALLQWFPDRKGAAGHVT